MSRIATGYFEDARDSFGANRVYRASVRHVESAAVRRFVDRIARETGAAFAAVAREVLAEDARQRYAGSLPTVSLVDEAGRRVRVLP